MEVHFKPDVQAKLEQMARETGLPSDELVEDAVVGLFDELAYTRQTLDRRYDDLESGRVKPIPGDEVFARLRAKSAARRASTIGYEFHPEAEIDINTIWDFIAEKTLPPPTA